MVNRSRSGSRTSALITPDTAITIQQTSAIAENLVVASARSDPRLRPCASSAMSPPTHTAAATRWNSRLLVAMSCEPPPEEWPVTATGTSANSARKNSTAVQPQDRTRVVPSAISATITAVITHARACSIRPTTWSSSAGLNRPATGCPNASAAVNGTASTAPSVHSSDDHPAVRSAAYPSAANIPEACGGTRNAASSSDPMVTTAADSVSTRTTIRPTRSLPVADVRPAASSAAIPVPTTSRGTRPVRCLRGFGGDSTSARASDGTSRA